MNVTTYEYYRHMYPYAQLVKWLTSQGHALECFEFAVEAMHMDSRYMRRFQTASTPTQLRNAMSMNHPGIVAIHIGGIWPEGVDRTTKPSQHIFSIDIDLTDYDFLDLKGADGKLALSKCDRAYPVAAFAVYILRHLLEHAFGFHQILVCYSGRRGVHLHALDKRAVALDAEGRSAAAAFMNVDNFTLTEERASRWLRTVAEMYGLINTAMDFFTHTLVGEMGLFDNSDGIRKFVERLKLTHETLSTLLEDATDKEDGPAAWELVRERVASAGVGWFVHRLQDVVLFYVWPRMDEKVTTDVGHLVKAPFCAHAKTRRIAVPLGKDEYMKWHPAKAPSLDKWDQVPMDAGLALMAVPEPPPPPPPPPPPETEMPDVEELVAPAPRPLPRKIGFKRKPSPLVPN